MKFSDFVKKIADNFPVYFVRAGHFTWIVLWQNLPRGQPAGYPAYDSVTVLVRNKFFRITSKLSFFEKTKEQL